MLKIKIRVLLMLGAFFSLVLFPSISAKGQKLNTDEKAIGSLIDQWNYANNSRSIESFNKVYADELLFYTQRMSRSQAIARKDAMVRKNPDFRQRIVSAIRYTPYTSGVIRCDFTKEVREYTRWKKYPAYLLVSYEGNRYRIVGESDALTDKRSGFRLAIGEPMDLGKETPHSPSLLPSDSIAMIASGTPDTASGTDLPAYDYEDTHTVVSESDISGSVSAILSSKETVPVRRDHIFILVGILMLGGLMIFVADAVQTRKRLTSRASKRSSSSQNVLEDMELQSRFQAFVLTLFDPLYFSFRRPGRERVPAGNFSERLSSPDVEFRFRHKESSARFGIHCLFCPGYADDKIRLASREQMQNYLAFQEETDMEVYYVVGVGGRAEDPKELFLIPVSEIKNEILNKYELDTYRKSGMFFFSSATRKLQ